MTLSMLRPVASPDTFVLVHTPAEGPVQASA